MRFLNCNIKKLKEMCREYPVFVFGLGSMFWNKYLHEIPNEIWMNISYFVDNNPDNEYVSICNKMVRVCRPDRLMNEEKGIVLLTSSMYMMEMYKQLESFSLPDSVICMALPFIREDDGNVPSAEENAAVIAGDRRIPRIIHSFWFSGEDKPEVYKKCMESWRQYCPDFEIKEWNLSNYDVGKHPFMLKALEARKWAFVSDYARLDVVHAMGGIYMDMDVQLFKPIEDLLGNNSIFSFNQRRRIDLAVFASVAGNPLLEEMMNKYSNKKFNSDPESLAHLCQPDLLKDVFCMHGVIMNGKLQKAGEDMILPRTYFMPMDPMTRAMDEESDYTYGVHLCNGSWLDQEELYRQRRMMKEMWSRIESWI